MRPQFTNESSSVTLFGEERVIVDERDIAIDGNLRTERRSEIVADLRGAQTSEERERIVRSMLRTIGFDWLGYARITRIGDTFQKTLFFRTYKPPQWAKRYVNERYFEIDPRMQFACRYEWPFVWDLSYLVSAHYIDPRDARAKRFLDDAESAGLRSGVIFGLANPRGLEHTVISFSSTHPTKDWIADSIVGQTYAVGLSIHEFLTRHTNPSDMDTVALDLSDLQRKILNFVICGLSDREIASHLNTSSHNVDYHLRQLRKKYNVQNRVQLAYIAGRLMVV
jgi:DNA-binding CsgD family transcriptional regulator